MANILILLYSIEVRAKFSRFSSSLKRPQKSRAGKVELGEYLKILLLLIC